MLISSSRIISRYSRYELLFLDEPGYVPFTQKGNENPACIFQLGGGQSSVSTNSPSSNFD